MPLKSEEIICCDLRPILSSLEDGDNIQDSEELNEVLVGLEVFLSIIFQDRYNEWKYEGLDGIYLSKALRTGLNEAELIGICILISDQTLTPIHIRLRLAISSDEIEWLDCKLGV